MYEHRTWLLNTLAIDQAQGRERPSSEKIVSFFYNTVIRRLCTVVMRSPVWAAVDLWYWESGEAWEAWDTPGCGSLSSFFSAILGCTPHCAHHHDHQDWPPGQHGTPRLPHSGLCWLLDQRRMETSGIVTLGIRKQLEYLQSDIVWTFSTHVIIAARCQIRLLLAPGRARAELWSEILQSWSGLQVPPGRARAWPTETALPEKYADPGTWAGTRARSKFGENFPHRQQKSRSSRSS